MFLCHSCWPLTRVNMLFYVPGTLYPLSPSLAWNHFADEGRVILSSIYVHTSSIPLPFSSFSFSPFPFSPSLPPSRLLFSSVASSSSSASSCSHYGPEQPRIAVLSTGPLARPFTRRLTHMLGPNCFTCALRCTHSFARFLAHSRAQRQLSDKTSQH